MSRPVPSPRAKIVIPDKFAGGEPVKCRSPPQSPTKPSKGGVVGSTPPPVLPKKFIIKKCPEGPDTVPGTVDIIKVVTGRAANDTCNAQAPPIPIRLPVLPVHQPSQLDDKALLKWWKNVKPWNVLCKDDKLRGVSERKIIAKEAEQLYKALRLYILLFTEDGGRLKEQTDELLCIADNLDKVSKGTKIAGITGGATTVAGGVAAAAGVILSPFTLGASLALTVVGVGVATAGGVTGASAAIANKVKVSQDKKKIEKSFEEYQRLMEDIQDCLKFINEGMGQLKQHDLSVLSEARKESRRVAAVIELAATGGGSAKAIEASCKASGLMQGFANGIDIHFTKSKDGHKLKKGHESKLAKNIRELVAGLKEALDELEQIKNLFSEHCDGV